MKYVVLSFVAALIIHMVITLLQRARRGVKSGSSAAFRMPIDDVFRLPGQGSVVVSGIIAEGKVSHGDRLALEYPGGRLPVSVAGVEVARRIVPAAKAGQQAAVLLTGVEQRQVPKGAVLVDLGNVT